MSLTLMALAPSLTSMLLASSSDDVKRTFLSSMICGSLYLGGGCTRYFYLNIFFGFVLLSFGAKLKAVKAVSLYGLSSSSIILASSLINRDLDLIFYALGSSIGPLFT